MATEINDCLLTNPVVGSINLCTGTIEYDSYNYTPHRWVCAVFVTLFAITSILHLAQAIRSRQWFMLPTICICAAVELLGWSGRLWSNVGTIWIAGLGGFYHSPLNAFLMQISTLIFAPAFLAAFWYILLGKLIAILGPQYCRFTPKLYTICFVTGDLGSLIIQAVGGGLASSANTLSGANHGAYVMVGGVICQMVVSILYCFLLFEFIIRYTTQRPVAKIRIRKTREPVIVHPGTVPAESEHKARILISAMCWSTLLIFIRSIYRTIELLGGWNGAIIDDEKLFCILDGLMVFLATFTFNIVHPLYFYPNKDMIGKRNNIEKIDGIVNNV